MLSCLLCVVCCRVAASCEKNEVGTGKGDRSSQPWPGKKEKRPKGGENGEKGAGTNEIAGRSREREKEGRENEQRLSLRRVKGQYRKPTGGNTCGEKGEDAAGSSNE